ncbi:long-chain fatty acid transport protein 2-like [Asterias amurensis]|uniref:long-chain fatty acid transport protein 2-like n=1 Tax=Asterias amurensis TaxID=7602 RepID=UPI003AB5B70D
MGLLFTIVCSLLAGIFAVVVYILWTYPTFFNDLSEFLHVLRSVVKPIEKVKSKGYLFVDVFESKVRDNPKKPLILFKDEVHTYSDVDRTANKVANYLRGNKIVQFGDVVGIFMQNEPAYVSTSIALLKLYVTGALLNINLRGEALLHCIRVGQMRKIICGHALIEAMREIQSELEADNISVFVIKEAGDDTSLTAGFLTVDLASPLASSDVIPRDVRKGASSSDPALYFYTSGTTGMPKAARLTQEKVVVGGMILQLYHLGPSDVMYIPLPLFHSAGMVIGLYNVISAGGTVVLRTKFSASQFWNDVRQYKANVVQYIGEICRYLLAQPKSDLDGKYSHTVRLAIGSGLGEDIWVDFKERFNIKQIGEMYAATEGNRGFFNLDGTVGAVGTYTPLMKKLAGGIEIIDCNWETAEPIRDATGKCIILPKGKTGLLVTKITRAAPFSGYVAGRAANEKKVVKDVRVKGDYYFNTGDLMMIDETSHVFFKDRLGETFRWKGENVSSSEVAAVLTELSFITEAVIYGVKVKGYDGRVGMAAIAIQDEDQASQWKQLYTHVIKRLPMYACPKLIRIKGQMETTNTYKYRKVSLVKEGFEPGACMPDRLFFMDKLTETYVTLDASLYDKIINKETIVH